MMIDLTNRLVDNDLTREELLNNVEVTNTTYVDAPKLVELLSKCFGLYSEMDALRQLIYSNAMLDNSVKLIDRRNGDIYGFLILSKFSIYKGSPILRTHTKLGAFLIQYEQINGHSFIIDERLRGTGLDKKMLEYVKPFINQFDFVWAAVENTLKTHMYWKKLGFKELFKIPDATFYIMLTDKSKDEYIYSLLDKLKT